MAKLNPIEQSQFIEYEFRNYLKSTFSFSDEIYQKMFLKELDSTKLYKGPFIKATLPFKTGKSLNELIEEKTASTEFRKLSKINLNQKLYVHQEEAFKKIMNGDNVVITTGTGSGKTESFLYPIINSILKEIEEGKNPKGIRAVFLYPMNALVNDQIARVRKILSNYPEIRYGFFTGDTVQKKNIDAYRKELEVLNDCEIPVNELITREQIREEIPHLLFTNYSMLEYLLIRPNDYVLFKKEMLDNWRYVVLDEAHTYKGALGIEVAMLLRRLSAMANKKPQFILTSATLGDKGKSEKDIVEFAEALTSAKYNLDSIIFSTRQALDFDNIEYEVKLEDYIELDKNNLDLAVVSEICRKYIKLDSSDPWKWLYELLKRDRNVYKLYDNLIAYPRFKDLLEHTEGFNELQLVSLIHLINIAKDGYKFLYDLKYHTFIRTLGGAFVTLGDNKQLRLSSAGYINGKKAFELGNCRYCNTSYIIGRIGNDNVLYQNSDIDIYENYDEGYVVNVDYFLIKNSVDLKEFDLSGFEEFVVCSKCGHIHHSAEIEADDCKCGENFKIELFKVSNDESRNNIYECPCCRHHSQQGIVRNLSLGKDEATALLGQVLYQAIDDNETETEVHESDSLLSFEFEGIKAQKLNDERKAKQYIAFSDSRQQASFFASFFEYNFKRFLRNRILLKCLEDNSNNSLTFKELILRLKKLIEKYNLFSDDGIDSEKQAWITALRELLKVEGQYTGEGLGLFYFKLDIDEIKTRVTADMINKHFGKYGLTPDNFFDFIMQIFDAFRTIPAINYDLASLSEEERVKYFEYRNFKNYSKLKSGSKSKDGNIRSFLPINSRANLVVDYTMRACSCSFDEACKIIEMIYNTIGKNGKLLEKTEDFGDEAYRINAYRYSLYSCKNTKVYRCKKCGTLTVYNINDTCIKKGCEGSLELCDPDEVLKQNYYRQQYISKKIESMIVKEHTAQLTRQQGKEYQIGFKKGDINVLSCSTTFEMGVDIGSLETVFMRNVPPTPANYVQRAGRAGRSKDSSAFILTFCNNSSHDYTYFENPTKMIEGTINPPRFTVTNEKIIIRHLLAAAFGFFFRENPDYFKDSGKLICEGGLEKFKEYLDFKPESLNKYINELLDEKIYSLYSNFKWYELMQKKYDLLEKYIDEVNAIINDFNQGIEEALAEGNYKQADYYQGQIKEIKSKSLIKDLTDHGVIPKYGFPVDVVDLKVYKDGIINDKYNLNRDLSIAISEYAPESEVIVDKEKYTSRYITLPKKDEHRRHYYFKCSTCDRTNVVDIISNVGKCEYCEAITEVQKTKYYIEPTYGFKTGVNKQTTRKKPKKTYSSEKIYLGNGDLVDYSYDLNERVKIETSSDDKLLVMNVNPFFMCSSCGYTEIEKKNPNANVLIKKHKNYRDKPCQNEELIRIALGHEFKTDVAKIIVKSFTDRKVALSTLYALLEGISIAFNIERTDIDGLCLKDVNGDYNLVLYDNVPGGAGHIKRLRNKTELELALQYAEIKVNQNCCDETTSCYNCLRNYNNQKNHNELSRSKAKLGLEAILNK